MHTGRILGEGEDRASSDASKKQRTAKIVGKPPEARTKAWHRVSPELSEGPSPVDCLDLRLPTSRPCERIRIKTLSLCYFNMATSENEYNDQMGFIQEIQGWSNIRKIN